MKRLSTLVLIVIAVFAFATVLSGTAWLENAFVGGLPIGNAIAALALICASIAALRISAPNSFMRWFAGGAVFLSVVWLPGSIALAGNLSLNFNAVSGPLWIGLSLITLTFAAISLLFATVKVFGMPRHAHTLVGKR